MSKKDQLAKPDGVAWAEFSLLRRWPPASLSTEDEGREPKGHLVMLAAKTYRHPLSGGALNVPPAHARKVVLPSQERRRSDRVAQEKDPPRPW